MKKIITFSWTDPSLFEKKGLPIVNNESTEVLDELAVDAALEKAKICFEAGLNVMLSRIPDRDIIWVAVDNKKFGQR